MNLLYNGQFLHEKELQLPLSNRAFQYNDGFFETMMIVNGRIRFWSDHLDRIQAAAYALHLSLPAYFSSADLESQLLALAEKNNATEYGRLKLKVWRGGAGIYTPETNAIEWIATVSPAKPTGGTLEKVGICSGVRTNYSSLSGFKGPNSLLYVMAGVEKKKFGYDDVILLNRQDLVAELTSSNIFWQQQGTLFTPSLETGCVNGIIRRKILKWCLQEGIKIKEVFFDVDAILPADVVFSANVTGLRVLKNLIGFDLKQDNELVSFFQKKIANS